MANKLIKKRKGIKGFSLVELLIALGIFAIVVSANFTLAMNAYRGRANDRVRLEAGLVIKDTVNGIYTYKSTNWSALVSAMQDPGSKRLDLSENKFQLNSGSWNSGNITFEMFVDKASRTNGEINPEDSGGDPDTVKLTVVASWKDFFGIEQEISEDYFLSNWASERWSETTYAEFTDGVAATPGMNKTQVENDNGDGSVVLGSEVVYANSDWCNINIKSVDTGSNTQVDLLASKRSQTNLGYEIYEPVVADFDLDPPSIPLAPAENTITLNNITAVCDYPSEPMQLDCETLAKLYTSLDGENWSNKDGWESIDTEVASSYCDWNGVTCVASRVTKIELHDNNLSGSIPREIGNLSELEVLSLTHSVKNTDLTGPIPPEIGLLENLESLVITNSSINGRIPETIGNSVLLEELVIDNTEVTGSIPASIGLLTNLEALTLKDSKLTCHVPPEVTLLTGLLADADLSGNNLLQTRYEEIGNIVNLDNQGSPLSLDEGALVDCARNPAESNIVLSKSDLSEETIENITLSNTSFPPSDFVEEIEGLDKSNWTSTGLVFSNDVVEVPFNNSYNRMSEGSGFTISMWVNPSGSNGVNNSRFLDFSDGSAGWFLSFGSGGNSNKAYFQHYGTNSIVLTSTNDLSGWTHVAVVMDGGEEQSTARMYINGTQVATDTYEELSALVDSNAQLRIGNNSSLTLGASATLDELRLYRRALSQNEINLSKNFEVGRDDPGLVGYWRMNHEISVSNQTVLDYSPDNNNGTAGNSSLLDGLDPGNSTGRVEYRINSIYHHLDKIYFGTSHPSKNLLIYDKTTQQWSDFSFGISGSNNDTQGILIEDDMGLVLHDSYLIKFDPDAETLSILSQTQINPAGIGIKNPISMGISGDRIFMTGLDSMKNLQFIDIEENGDFVVNEAKNILLDTYL